MKTWLFHADPQFHDLQKEIIKGRVEDWRPWVYVDEMEKGDRVVLWQSGPRGGVHGFGHLAGRSYLSGKEHRVNICYDELLDQPAFKAKLRKHPVLRNLSILKMPNGKNPSRVQDQEYRALKDLIASDVINIFSSYSQEENRFTNGLVSILDLSRYSRQSLFEVFLRELLNFDLQAEIRKCRVLTGIDDSTADAELCGTDIRIRIETKTKSGTLREDQISSHLDRLKRCREERKVLVILTPDDGSSGYIRKFLANRDITSFRSSKHHVLHLEWRRVYEFFEQITKGRPSVFRELVSQYLTQIRGRIFDQDFAGIIQKISFGDMSEVYPDTYLDEVKKWSDWNTPREYKKLDGTGRRLLLYDKTRSAITVEAEIGKVEKFKNRGEFPVKNTFVPGSLKIDKQLVPLARIQKILGFENFKSGRAAAWNVTQEQYRQLGISRTQGDRGQRFAL